MDHFENYSSVRAQAIYEEEYKPLRAPNSPITNIMHETVANTFQQLQINPICPQTSLLSPHAKEFVPQGRNIPNYGNENNNYRQQQIPETQIEQIQYQQQNYSNGYHQHQQQNHYQQQQQQQQLYHQHVMQMPTTKSVQDRLNPTLYGQQVQQQQPLHQQRQQHAQQYQRQNNHARYQHHHQQQLSHEQPQHHQQQNHNQQELHSKSPNNSPSPSSTTSSVETIALDYLKTVMQCLNQNPGQYDTVATRFLNVFEGMENNDYVLANAMEDIFEESIQNPNFRYMGAKLYNLLHMLNPKSDSFFNMLLKCKLDFHQQQVKEYLATKQTKKVHETALFLAELYMQLSVGGDELQRIQLIAENIIYSLKQLLNATLADNLSEKEATDNVRCICMTLKLAGYDLTTDCGADIAQIIAQLEAINAQAPGKYPMAANVINLQKNNWGRKPSSSSFNSLDDEFNGASGEPTRQNEILRASDEPIFYGPDGRELTAEEAEFLANGISPDSATDDDDANVDPDIEYDLEMDEETEKAYKEFCKLEQK